ncbi:MAG: ABC transporter ATP-binding protein, partial [Candidatus Aenigmarchaeota archaeon]|nr:ABC transporter ATP-binding protein [Candidatus Aenigmarchaeota archaeon]
MAIKDNPVIYLTSKLWEYSKGNRKNVVLYSIMFIIANMFNLISPLVIAKVLNTIQENGLDSTNLYSIMLYLSVFIFMELGFWTFHGPAMIIQAKNSFLVRANYKKYLLDRTMSLPAQWHTDHHSGDTIDKIEKGTGALYRYSSESYEVIQTLVLFLGSYIALMYFNIHASYIVLLMMIITLGIILRFDSHLVKKYRELYWAENRISAKIFDVVSNITTVIILRTERLVSKAIFRKMMQPFRLHIKTTKQSETKWFFVSICTATMMVLVLTSYVYFNFMAGTAIMIGSIFALYSYVGRIKGLFFRFAYKYSAIVREKTAIQNAEEISDEFSKKKRSRPVKLGKEWKELKINSLRFSYHTKEGADLHLDNVSLTIKNAEKIALIGESGSGKTTLLKIIRELYTPKHIKLYLDEKLLNNGFKDINKNIALIPQDPEIFSTTIKNNITMGINRKQSYIKKYTDMARFTDVAERLPKKLNSNIVEKGVNLSGGQKQRLALARGLMACEDKSIILLDEPTSSVDFRNETAIYDSIFREFKDKTIISS